MDEDRDEAAFAVKLLRNFGTIFTFSVLAMIFAGMLTARYASYMRDMSTLFALGKAGLSFNTLLQIAAFSLVLAFFAAIIFSERIFGKIWLSEKWFIKLRPINARFLQRSVLLLLASMLTLSVFAATFKWFAIKDPLSWLKFLLSTFVCFSASIGLTLLKQKLESKKYDRLLASFKARHGEPRA